MSTKNQKEQKDIDFRLSVLEDPKSKNTDKKQALKILRKKGILK